jgi:PAS domain S-box-containing protein
VNLRQAVAGELRRLLRSWPPAAVVASTLVIAVALHVAAWGHDTSWPWVSTIALFYLVPVALAALYLGRPWSLVVAGITVLTLLPLVWRALQLDHSGVSLAGLGAVALTLVTWAVLLGSLVDALRVQADAQAKQVYQSATWRVRQLATLNDIGKAVVSSLDLDTRLSQIMERVQDALDVESGSLMLLEDGELVFHTSFGPVGEQIKPYRLEIGQGIAGWVALTGETLLIPNAKRDSRHFGGIDQAVAYQTRSILCVPLKGAGNEIVGVLEVLNPRERETFTRQDQEMLESIAAFAVTAIENARLYRQTLRHVTDLYALNRIGKELTSILDIEEMLNKIADETMRLTGAARSQVLLLDRRARQVTSAVQKGYDDARPPLTFEQVSQGLSGWVLRESNSALSTNLYRDERMRAVDIELVAGQGARSMMVAPLLIRNEAVGVLSAIRLDDAAAFTDREVGVLSMLAGQASIAIENARSFEERRRRIIELSILNQTGQALSSTLKMDELIELIHSQVARVMDAQNFYIALYDVERDTISFPLAYEQGQKRAGPRVDAVSEEWLPRRGRKGLTEYLIRSGEALWIPKQVAERMAELDVERIGAPALSWLGVPILWGKRPLGAIAVQSYDQEDAYDEQHLELLTTIASQASVAMRNAQLFTEVNRMTENLESLVADRTEALAQANRELTAQRDRLNALYQIMRELSSSLEMERLLNRTLVLINHVLTAQQGYILIRDAGKTLVYKAAVGRTPPTPEGELFPSPRIGEEVSYREDQGLIGRLMSRPHSMLVDDLAVSPHWQIVEGQAQWHRSVLAAPLLSGEEIRGCILLYHRAADHFTGEQQRMLDAIASQIAVTVSSLEIFDLLSESADRLGTMLRLQQLEAAKSQAILEGVADGVMVTDANGRISLFNVAAERILHMSRSEVINRSESELPGLFELAGTSWTKLARAWGQERGGPSAEALYEERIEFEDRVISIRIAPVFRQDIFEGTVSVFRDITRDVEVERMKSEFVSMVSHELRTPMTSIKGYIDLLHNGMAGPMNDSQKRFLRTVKTNADRLTLLVNSLLDISRLDTGGVRLNLENVNPLDVITNVAAALQPKAAERDQTLVVLAKPPLPFVRADPDRVVQILTNLVDNALKYTPAGGQVTIDAREVDGTLHFSVRDNGIGIAEADQQKLFGRFFRAEAAIQSGASGAGLGLYITRSLIELHGGEIWVDSRENEGSTFTCSLPLATSADRPQAERAFKTISYRSQDRHILVVEDEDDLARQIVHHLQSLGGYRVHVSKRGRAALDYVNGNRRRIDVIALDLHLPDMDGGDLIQALRLRSASSDIPVIAISKGTGSSDAERQHILDLGAARFLPRPFTVAELATEIRLALPDRVESSEDSSVEETG